MFKEGEQFNIPYAKLAQQPPAEEVKEKPLAAAKELEQEKQSADNKEDKNPTMEDEVEKFDPIKDRLLKFLANEKILQIIDGYNVFDQTKLNNTEFIRRSLGHLYLGRKEDGKQLMGSKKIIFEKLADLEIVPLEDYSAKKERGEKITPLKFSDIITPPDLNNEERKAEVRAQMLKFLEKNDVLKVIGNLNVMDMTKLRNREFYNHLTNREFLTKDKRSFRGGQMLLFETLADFEVISNEDFQETIKKRANIMTKPLFNVPESVDEAFDLEKLKNKEYYLNYWDLYSREAQQPGKPQWNYQITAKNGETVNSRELGLVTELFRNHGGRRDENGNLLVFDKEKNDYVKVSAQWIIENIGSFGKGSKNGSGLHKPHQFLLNECPNLLAKGIVKLEDFRQKTGDISGNLMRKEFYPDAREFSANVDGVRYYLGRENNFIFNKEKIPTEFLKAVVLDDKTVGIVEIAGKKEILRFTLDLLSDEEKKEKRALIEERKPGLTVQQITAFTTVRKKEITDRIKPWEAEEDNPPMTGETHQEYSKRMRYIGDFDFIKQISKDFQKEQIGIHNLTWREQQWLCGAAYHLGRDYPKLLEFGKKYGLEGLRTFLSCEYDLGNGEKILNIGGNLPQDKAAKIFARYAEIVDSVDNIENILADVLKDKPIDQADNKISQEISQNLLKKGRDMLVDFAGKIEQGKKLKSAFNPEKILHELEEYRDNIILTATAYKSLAKDKEFNIEDLRGVTTEKLTARQLVGDKKIVEKIEKMLAGWPEWPTIHSSALRDMVNEYAQLSDDKDMEAAEQIIEMAHIYYDNYADNPALQKKLVKGFLQALKTGGDDVTVYTIKKDGEIMAFDRFDKIAEKKKYFSSFNVRPVIHGSAIGDALMKISLRPEARDNELEADCDPNKSISQKYIEDEGFVGRGINDYGGTAMTLNIYNKKDNNRYYYRQPGLNKAAVMADYEKTAQEAGQADRFVLKFKTGSSELFNAIDEYVNQGGYAITRYFFAGKGNEKVYCAFEKPSGDKGGN